MSAQCYVPLHGIMSSHLLRLERFATLAREEHLRGTNAPHDLACPVCDLIFTVLSPPWERALSEPPISKKGEE